MAAWRLVRLRRRGEEWPTNEVVWLLAALSGATAGVLGFRSPETRPDEPPS